MPYSRYRVATDKKNFELLILSWNQQKGSRIHDHPGDGCYVKVLSGSVRETLYDLGPSGPSFRSESVISSGDVCYIDNNLGVHQLSNPSSSAGAVTLHLYTPPMKDCLVVLIFAIFFVFINW